MTELVRKISWRSEAKRDPELPVTREWLLTNGLGGYASGTISGVLTRRYHGLLVAAFPSPLGRVVMLNHLAESFSLPDGRCIPLSADPEQGSRSGVPKAEHLTEFRLELGLPVWEFQFEGWTIEKRIILPHLQNTIHITYRLISGNPGVTLSVSPTVHFRPHEAPVSQPLQEPYTVTAVEKRYEISTVPTFPNLRFLIQGECGAFILDSRIVKEVLYPVEESRGYEGSGNLWSPGSFQMRLDPSRSATLVASTEPWQEMEGLPPEVALEAEIQRRKRLLSIAHPNARQGVGAELVLAADQFIIVPAGRAVESTRAHALGEEARTVIAGYHWFTDWGRDTMISLEGITLATGRFNEAAYILHMFANHVRDGLIPNMFPEHQNEGLYHTADATLWFFHAIDRYIRITQDRETLQNLLPALRSIIEHHLRGTRFGIGVDAADGLLRQGEKGYQLTWMDAKMGDWVVTPRRGKAVEINALYYNALRLMQNWLEEAGDSGAARHLQTQADQAQESFNQRFWNQSENCLYDVVDGEGGNDPACRPNQIFAISLPHPVLDPKYWQPVMDTIEKKLLTPVGLRTLSQDHPDYKKNYHGDLRTRDAAYHQGTVWPWLMGHFVDAWIKLHPDKPDEARQFFDGICEHLDDGCIGSISEVFDAEPPFRQRGCVAQAWSIAEALRILAR
jgi:predicted glycogen debranching enzyme